MAEPNADKMSFTDTTPSGGTGARPASAFSGLSIFPLSSTDSPYRLSLGRYHQGLPDDDGDIVIWVRRPLWWKGSFYQRGCSRGRWGGYCILGLQANEKKRIASMRVLRYDGHVSPGLCVVAARARRRLM